MPPPDDNARPAGRLARIFTNARTWLLLVAAGAGWRMHSLGLLITDRVQDTPSYEWPWPIMSAYDILMNARTVGYPVVLTLWSWLFESQALLPLFQFLVYAAAVFVFWHALALYSQSEWFAFAAAVPLLITDLWPYFRRLQPDTLAPAATLVALAGLLALAVDPRRRRNWAIVGVSVAGAYHLRPSYIFLAALAPLLGCAFHLARNSSGWRQLRRFAAMLVLVCLLPVFVYAGLRWLTVKQFGVANMVGYSIVGIAANFLDQQTVDRIPEEHRRLADRTLYWRQRRNWEPYTLDSDSDVFFTEQYVPNQWSIAEPLARRFEMERRSRLRERRGDEVLPMTPLEAWYFENRKRTPLGGELSKAVSDRLQNLSTWLIRENPHLYRKWLIDASTFGLRGIGDVRTVRWSAALLAMSGVAWIARGGWKRRRRGARSTVAAAVWSLWALGVGFYLASLALMVLVSYPLDRYQVAATLFIAPAMTATAFALWRGMMGTACQSTPLAAGSSDPALAKSSHDDTAASTAASTLSNTSRSS